MAKNLNFDLIVFFVAFARNIWNRQEAAIFEDCWCNWTRVFKILFRSFLVEKLRCFKVDSFIEKLMVKFVRENLSSKLWCNLLNGFLAQDYVISRSSPNVSRNILIFWCGLVSLFNGISTFVGLFNVKVILVIEKQWHYWTHSWRDKGDSYLSQGY